MPFKISQVLTDNGKEFTARFCVNGEQQPAGRHPFDKTCSIYNILHRLIKPPAPAYQWNDASTDVSLKSSIPTHFDSSQTLSQTIMRYVRLYNYAISQKSLGRIFPLLYATVATKTATSVQKTRLYLNPLGGGMRLVGTYAR